MIIRRLAQSTEYRSTGEVKALDGCFHGGVSDMGLLFSVWILERSQLWMTLDGNCDDRFHGGVSDMGPLDHEPELVCLRV